MNRREFFGVTAAGVAGLCIPGSVAAAPCFGGKKNDYSVIVLGDTHFDTEPASVYHSNYNEPVEWLNRVQRAEFARNGEMWRERCPRILKRDACLISEDTKMIFQTGDLIQGDCGKGEVHRQMLDDVMNRFKAELGGLPFVTVEGNHDIRGVGAQDVYHEYMPKRMSQELGKEITKTTFSFNIGNDAYIVIDFNHPDDAEIEKLLKETKGARHTFVLIHGPLFPYDAENCRWFFHGGASDADMAARRHFRAEFAKRNVICLCGHAHTTDFMDWRGDGGRITQMTMNCVWSRKESGIYAPSAEGAAQYGELRKKSLSMPDGSNIKDESAIFDEYRPGIVEYIHSGSAGAYKLNVSGKKVWIDFYAGDSSFLTKRFDLRG